MKSLLNLLHALSIDGSALSEAHHRTRDMEYATRRVEHEGLSFLTVTLPKFGAEFDLALKNGYIPSESFTSFKRRRKGSHLPAFLQGFVGRVFDDSGVILPDPCHNSIYFVRQLTKAFKKIELPCTPRRMRKEALRFKEVDQNDVMGSAQFDPIRVEEVKAVSLIFSRIIRNVEDGVINGTLIPQHGPGAVADKLKGNSKWELPSWSTSFEHLFPADRYALVNLEYAEELDKKVFVEPDEDLPMKVHLVFKDLEKPRVIGIEPSQKQYVQQAVKRELYASLEKDPWTAGHVNFTDQTTNQELARRSSVDGYYATIDLSDASNLVGLDLVTAVFGRWDIFHDVLMSTRSRECQYTSPTLSYTVELKKFAGMGSALCFPIEAMVFYTICIAAIVNTRGLPLTFRSFREVRKEVFVYGDDIIVPAHEASIVMDYLESFGLKINTKKSFETGKFRESCGAEYYDGTWVTPTYVRSLAPRDDPSPHTVLSWVSLANQLYLSGCWNAAKYCRRLVEQDLGHALAVTPIDNDGVTWVSHLPTSWGGRRERNCPNLHRKQVWGLRLSTRSRADSLEGHPALLKCLLQLEAASMEEPIGLDRKMPREVLQDKTHLEETVDGRASALIPGWVYLGN